MQKKIALKAKLQSYFFLWNYKRVIDFVFLLYEIVGI